MSNGKQLIRDFKVMFGGLRLERIAVSSVDELDQDTIDLADSLAGKYNIKEELKCPCGGKMRTNGSMLCNLPQKFKTSCGTCGVSAAWEPSQAEAEQAWRDLFQRGD